MKLLALLVVLTACGGHSSTNNDIADGSGATTGHGDGPNGCMIDGDTCSIGTDCCSTRCETGVCLPSNSCLAPGATCVDGPTNNCCSSRCEPVEGHAGQTQCADICDGNGAACAKATDCCDLDCNAGKCGGAECKVESETCGHNADCCSNICTGGQCQLDAANTTCRGIGETCNSGPQQGCCSMVCDDTQNPPRCDFATTVCKAQNSTCTMDSDCCDAHCDPTTHECATVCIPTAGACTTGADCCSSICTAGSCAMAPPTCTAVGTACTTGASCCSNLCIGGFCDLLQ